MQPHRWQPTRLPCPWNSPGKNTGVACHFLLQCMKVKSESEVAQSCLTLSDPVDCSPPGCSIHGIFQARVLEWGSNAFYTVGSYDLFLNIVMCICPFQFSNLFLPPQKSFKEVTLITQSEWQEVIWRKGRSGCQVKGTAPGKALRWEWSWNVLSGKRKKGGQGVWSVEGEGESDEDATGEESDVASY